ncbi:molybdopterin-dependent oxidoreductase, partial [Synergistaceae bacterium OttesenSCG-928-I11]|nr:molybdopterin-dependent oxidoreductase [Synergistaceae bacterium OttesenSCG-928-I11]
MDVQKRILIINGVERAFVCNPEKDSLADVVRRLGLTGTKVGCGAGQCGSCSLLLDGKVVRACIKKMKSVPEYASVETIEGIGTAENLHPLQQAFITYGSVQCGFCSPGFIMSAKALLSENPNPSRQDVRDWFTKNMNICRCTGYKPIVDAVMAAAAVMRGEKTMDDITFKAPGDGRIYGTDYPKPLALTRVLGTADYGDDVALKMPHDALHLALVMPYVHHAEIKKIDFAEAEKMPGVVKVLTAADVKGSNRMLAPQGIVRKYADGKERPVLCDKKLFRYGDVVAVVAARTREEARAAAAAVKVDYKELPAYLNYVDATAPDAAEIHPGTPNCFVEQPLLKGENAGEIIDRAKYAVEGSFSSTREPHLPIEPDAVQAYPTEDGVTVLCKSQFLYGDIAFMADAIGLPKDKIRIAMNHAGGSFGYSMCAASYAIAAVCAMDLRVPVSLVMSYPEHQHFTGKRSPSYTNARLACDEKGKFIAMDYHTGIDHGAYSDFAGALTSKVCRFFGYPYQVPNIRGLVQTAFSNHNHGITYRAFGSPQAYTASEQLVDMLAEKIGMDPFELRYINVAQEGDLCTNSVPYRWYPMKSMMDTMRPHYEAALERAKKFGEPGKKRGVGLAWGGYHVGKSPDHSEIDIELNPDGSVTHYNTWQEVGQGGDIGAMVHAHEALRPLGLKPEQIHLVQNDTATCPDTGSSSGSRSHHVAGMATIDGANQLIAAMKKPDGTFRTYEEMKAEGIPTKYRGVYDSKWADLDPDTGHGWGAMGQNYCLYLAEVDVEVATGKVKVDRMTLVSDIGKVGSYQSVLGQAWGGFSHSLGFALTEDYDDVVKHATMAGAGVPKCNDVPDDMDVIFHESEHPDGPHGSTGCSESYQSSGHVAILNAIANATGARIYTLPAKP